ncbi:MAG: hypothetical protein PHC53_02015 [Patescibacteria group bacterium]|nr:hypothetical protein [Patescibacteria group bacterium]
MIHIEGHNFQPLPEKEARLLKFKSERGQNDLVKNWQDRLASILRAVVRSWATTDCRGPAIEEVSCYFAPDFSTPTDSYPPALLRVHIHKTSVPIGKLSDCAESLGKAGEDFLNMARGPFGNKVHVVLDLIDPEKAGYYSTKPPKK